MGAITWAQAYDERGDGPVAGTQFARYRLSSVVRKGGIDAAAGQDFLLNAGLLDFQWEVTWPEDYPTFDEELEQRFRDVDGYVIFVHGWTGNHRIWEEMPGLAVMGNRHLVALSVDYNGFGQSAFVDETPALESCNPPAAMQTLQRWVDLLRIRRQPGERHLKVINFVGHSMGGAALFYLNPTTWGTGEETRYALAPALLLHDELHKGFFTTLGFGIGLVDHIKLFTIVEKAIKPELIETLCAGCSPLVKQVHSEQYDSTPRGVTARTLVAMGLLDNHEIARRWDLFRVMLGHKDRMVGLIPMMDLLTELEFPASNVRVVSGSHYMFSIGEETVFQHCQNRDLAVLDILALHEAALNQQRVGLKVGGKASFG